jgi:hypothetical protein
VVSEVESCCAPTFQGTSSDVKDSVVWIGIVIHDFTLTWPLPLKEREIIISWYGYLSPCGRDLSEGAIAGYRLSPVWRSESSFSIAGKIEGADAPSTITPFP